MRSRARAIQRRKLTESMRLKDDELNPESERPVESVLRDMWAPPNPALACGSDPAWLSNNLRWGGWLLLAVLTGASLMVFALVWALSQ